MKNMLTALAMVAALSGCPAMLSDWPIASNEGVVDAPDGQVGADPVIDGGSLPESTPDTGLPEAAVTDAATPVDAPDDSIALADVGSSVVDSGPNGSADSACDPVTHMNGVGQSWQDCVATGTYTAEQAIKACAALTGDASKCEVATACPTGTGIVDSGFTSYVWEYEGPLAGRVFGGQAGCTPVGGTSVWN